MSKSRKVASSRVNTDDTCRGKKKMEEVRNCEWETVGEWQRKGCNTVLVHLSRTQAKYNATPSIAMAGDYEKV